MFDTAALQFSAMAFGEQHPNNYAYFKRALESTTQYTGALGQEFALRTQQMYNAFSSSQALQVGKAALNQVRGLFQANVIRQLRSLDDFQIATPIMQQYVMANPTIRSLYQQQRCDGYSNSYVDFEPEKIGEEHSDWRSVMSGAVVETEDGGWHSVQYTNYAPTSQELDAFDKHSIEFSWDSLDNILAIAASDPKARDPSSPWNSQL